MNPGYVLIRYGELGLKGRNRAFFEKTLKGNIGAALSRINLGEDFKIKRLRGRILAGPFRDVLGPMRALSKVFGITSLSPVRMTSLDMESIKETAKAHVESLLDKRKGEVSFKVEARRAEKSFPLNSQELAKALGAYIDDAFSNLKPRMTGPELVLHVDLRPEGVFIYSERIQGPGGLPVGTQGKGIVLLSGGIDSPVAAWLAMKRGLVLEALHFDSYPYTSRQSLDKVKKIVRILSEWAGEMKLHVVNFTETQETIRDNCNERYHTVLFRRMMARVGDGLAERIGAKALVSGENLGQVASQTIENIHCVESVCSRPVLKPLITYDKQEIIDLAKRIGTFETSILPYPDCCTVFTPKKPIIRGDEAAAQREEKKLPLEELLAEAMETIETYTP